MTQLVKIIIAIGVMASSSSAAPGLEEASPIAQINDPESLYYHDFFNLPASATTADSMAALHLPGPYRMDPGFDFHRDYVYFTGTVLGMAPIWQERFPSLFNPETRLPRLRYKSFSALRLRVTSILSGENPGEIVEVVSDARTPDSPRFFDSRIKVQLLHPGAKIAGLMLRNTNPRLGDTPLLHWSSVFIFSSPQNRENLEEYRGVVLDLFRRSAAGMEAMQAE